MNFKLLTLLLYKHAIGVIFHMVILTCYEFSKTGYNIGNDRLIRYSVGCNSVCVCVGRYRLDLVAFAVR